MPQAANIPKHKRKRKHSKIEKADVKTSRVAARYRDSLPVKLLGKLSEISDQPPLRALCCGVFAIGLLRGDARMRRAAVAMLAAHQLATDSKSFIKHRIDRTRPKLLDEGGRYAMEPGESHAHELTSFPSGHTAGAVAVARAFAREYPQHGIPAYTVAALAALMQVPRAKHYPSDLAAGTAVALAAEAVTHVLLGTSIDASG